MNTLKLDYSNSKTISKGRKRILIILGIILIASGTILIIPLFSIGFKFSFLLSIIVSIYVGTYAILEALQHKLVFPEKYMRINSSNIEYKLAGIKPLRKIEWESIKKVRIKKSSIIFNVGNNNMKLSMLHFPSSDELKLKSVIKEIAGAKGIRIE